MSENVLTLSLFEKASYKNLFPEIPTLEERDYFLQFNGYEVYLPSAPAEQDSLNIFELSVLRLQNIGNFSVEQLGDKLCLRAKKPSGGYDYDLIKFICRRLNELGLLNETNQITDAGRVFLGDTDSASDLEMQPYFLLVTRDSQEILPVFFQSQNKKTGGLEKPEIRVTFGSTGKAKELKGRCVFVKEQGKRAQILPQNILHDALKKFNRRSSKKIRVANTVNIPSSYLGAVYLHVKAVLQDGNVDYLVVSDGLSSHSDFLRKYLERQNQKILPYLKESAQKIQLRSAEEKSVDRRKYSEIRDAMRRQEQTVSDVDSRKKAEESDKRQVKNLLKAVEWALRYHLLKFPLPAQLIAALEIQTPEENELMLTGFAKQIGIDTARHRNFFRNVAGALVKTATTRDPALNPLLPLNVAAAARNPDSKLLDALQFLPLEILGRLDRYGKSIRHTNSWAPTKDDTVDSLYAAVLKFIKALLPDYDNPDAVKADAANASIQKINAQISLFAALGEETFQELSPDVQELLLKISPEKDETQSLRAVEFMEVLSSILEKILREKISDAPEKISVPKSEIIQRLKKIGQTENWNSVSDFYYIKACEKEASTLGGYALAYFTTLDDVQLKKCAAENLPKLIFEIAGYRGHGTNLNLLIEADRLAELREKVFEVLKNRGISYDGRK